MTEEIPIRAEATQFQQAVNEAADAIEELADAVEQLEGTDIKLYMDGELVETIPAGEMIDISVEITRSDDLK